MKFDVQLAEYDLEKISPLAQKYERMGFDALWSYETNRNPFMPLAFAAQGTSTIKVGTNIALAFPRSPMITAMVAWDLQRASAGRFMLGLGTQVRAHNKRRLSAASESPAARVKEMIQCIRAIWDTFQNGTKPSFKGEFYEFTLITPFFDPGPLEHPQIPVFLAGVKPLMCRTAGEVADGFHIHPFHSPAYLKEVVRPNLDAGAKLRGKSVEDLELFSPAFVALGETEAERSAMEQQTRAQIAFYASTPNYRDVLDLHGWGAAGEELSKMARKGEWGEMGAKITDEMLDAFMISSDAASLAGKLRERYEGLVDRVSVYFPLPPDESEERWRAITDGLRHRAA